MVNFNFANNKVFVIGDLILDQFYLGKVSRISPEAPVPVVKITEIKNALGGAGNVVNNTSHLGAGSYLLSFAGEDDNRKILEKLLTGREIKYSLYDNGNPTISKIRVIGERQQVVRLDFEEDFKFEEVILNQFKTSIINETETSDSVIISDYGKGVCTPEICQFTINEARTKKIPVIVDPKGTDWGKYRGATMITPNVNELSAVAGYIIPNDDLPIEKIGREILAKYELENLLVTRSEKGMSLITANSIYHIPTNARSVWDVTGAGDTVVAVIAVSLGSGLDVLSSVKLANLAAGITVGKLGTLPIELYELYHAVNSIENSKIVTTEILLHIIKNAREENKVIVFTNGCFDILHKGHAAYLKEAKKLGDILIVGLNSDSSVKILKDEGRPLNNEDDRAYLLTSLEPVDYVTIFSDETPYELIKLIRPDILVKGGDYTPETVVGSEFSGEVVIIPFVDGYSSTKYINKMNKF